MKREYYIDVLRVYLTVLVVFHHSAISFGALGGWYYVSKTPTSGLTQMLLSASVGINQAFFMSLFFFISAFFMRPSFEKKGFRNFLKDRWIRLGIPLLVYILLLHPTLVYWIHLYEGKTDASWLSFIEMMNVHHSSPGPMWFVLTLLFFETIYAFYQKLQKGKQLSSLISKYPSSMGILSFILISGLFAYLIRLIYPVGKSTFNLQFGYFALYITMYIAGIAAYRNKWLDKISIKKSMPWFIISLIGILVFVWVLATHFNNLSSFNGGFNGEALFYAMWEPVVCVGISYFLLALSKRFFNHPNKAILQLSVNSYGAYIIHPMIVVCFTFLVEQLSISPLLKLVLVLVTGIPLCFAIASLLRYIPIVKKVL
ncbi:acyltransferase family protein [uncultured Bacteroides sp.]|uniref:acyltransferase family protein n=1 Tax=uncultured Bacteroides sp. TaxID=162156 RepID=UPI002AAAA438|nr:acyltransferase family protein [uncultured Bacteroides sp.]